MKIGVIGSGHIGDTLARHFRTAGHDTMVSSRESVAGPSPTTQESGVAGSFAEAAQFGEIVVLAIPWESAVMKDALPSSTLFSNKVVIDTMNPYRLDGAGVHKLNGTSSSDRVASLLPSARVVKAFNTMFWEQLRDNARLDLALLERSAIFLAANDEAAKEFVATLITEMGLCPVFTGGLSASAIQEPGTPIYNKPLTGAQATRALRSVSLQGQF